ncbi:MAG TPA: response regulator, partial [Pyrinomonadaceae bacterium]|nr:response regulator [Pyrinomonadaceae bacterium]
MSTANSGDQISDSATKAPLAPPPARTSYARILVVEDDKDLRRLLKALLERREGVSVIEAENGEMAVALAENVLLDLILIDATLPVLDGFEATRRIRQNKSALGVPIVFLSGHALPAVKAKAYAAGCTEYLVKPFDFDEWDRVLDRH